MTHYDGFVESELRGEISRLEAKMAERKAEIERLQMEIREQMERADDAEDAAATQVGEIEQLKKERDLYELGWGRLGTREKVELQNQQAAEAGSG